MGVFFASAVTQHQYSAVNELRSTQALYLTEAGFEMIIQELLDNQDYSFNGAGTDGVIGEITDVPLGAGTVSVTKGAGSPPVFTSTGTVGDIRRVVAMTLDVENLVTQYWNFPTDTDLSNGWKEFDKIQNNSPATAGLANPLDNGPSFPTDGTTSFEAYVDGPNTSYIADREQVVSVPANTSLVVRLDFKKNHNFSSGQPQSQELALLLWRSSDSTSQTLWSDTAKANDNLWQTVDDKGIVSGSPAFDRVRFRHDVSHNASALVGEETRVWIDNISISIIDKSAWNEP